MSKKEELTGFKKFANENKSLLFTIPVFVVLLVIVLFVYVFNGNKPVDTVKSTPMPTKTISNEDVATSTPTPTDTDSSTEVTTLPDSERTKDSDETYRNPFALPYKVSGIIYDSKGGSVTIIEAENKSYILKEGDKAEKYFTVLKIDKNSVIIEVEGEELTLTLLSD